ncbi:MULTISPECIES: DEAD/DEAH box helicase [Bacillaceae]|uniref:DEAD/DEAH box helicase n=1 Tax=Evansella alkalicola TaxID=745819 RepID=A0ABS6JNI3_9BACI|nr:MULTISPECIES: DEAD/DEAH box helicase [Bacillaceae]MBU9720110.1 DEAD/DEAH box helicase [Bacillus alkalicola]
MSNTWSIIPSLQPFLQEAWRNSNFTQPTAIQEKAVPTILEGGDVIAESPTGTGKTLAFLLPILNKIDVSKKDVQAVILASSKELVMQIMEEIRIWSIGSGIERASLIGGANVKRQLDKLKKKPHIIVGTPGRVQELIQMKKLKMHEVRTVVLDEGDQVFSNEHVKTVDQIIKSTLKDRQLLVFSATLSSEVEEKARERMKDPTLIRVGESESAGHVEHVYIVCEERDKISVLRKLMNLENMRALVFSNNIDVLSVYAAKLEYQGLPLGVLHSEVSKQERERSLKQFRESKFPLLLTTDVASRGLDIKGLNHVIQLEVPKEARQYTHRAGRTGRAGEGGTVISILADYEVKKLLRIGEELGLTMEERRLYKGELI